MKFARAIFLLLLGVTILGDERTHWSLSPIRRPMAPEAEGNSVNPIDRFVSDKLREKGLSLSVEARPGVLIRRAQYLLTGLPPSPEEVAAFEETPNYESLVERLLSSPEYGERWARHWLDVVRFAETHGFEMNQPRSTAWRYRDYVINAFNSDKPYDQFLREQIAGDYFGDDDATGFLVAGPWDQVKSPDPVLTANQRADELHDMVSTTASAMLGLTVGCARCHDHKFDPIPQVDYFAMKAVFEGVEHGERARKDGSAAVQRQRIEALRSDVQSLDLELESMEMLAQPSSTNRVRPAVHARKNVERFPRVLAKRLRFTIQKTTDAEPCIDELEVYSSGKTNVALASHGTKGSASGTYPNSDLHRLEHLNDGKYGNGQSWISNERGSGWVELEFQMPVEIEKVVWGRDREGKYQDRTPLEYRIEVQSESGEKVLVASAEDRLGFGTDGGDNTKLKKLESARKRLMEEIERREKALMVYAGSFRAEPAPTHRLHRGDPMLKREVIEPGPLTAVGYGLEQYSDAGFKKDQARRVAFANWVTDVRNPLTARVMVNRIWQYHFGTGIVDTPSDFGAKGGKPSHPDLLDWLAAELMESGWSVKHIQRLIVLSATFKQSSAVSEMGIKQDPNDRLLWRFPSRRLEAEAIRDSILAVSGKLDTRMGGAGFSFFAPNENYVRVYKPREDWGEESYRRMVYGTIVRQRPDGVFGAFDCPDAGQIAPKRTSSTTPLQALNLLNSSFILEQSKHFAERLRNDCGADLKNQVRKAFALAFQRKPTETETAAATAFIKNEGMVMFCRALLNANEFVYLF